MQPNDRDPARDRREALLTEYGEVANNFRLLTEIRFKLLAFLPIAAAAAAALKGAAPAGPPPGLTTLGLSLFGLIVTAGLVSYNLRNDQLYNELVGRAASIERSLDLPDGAFANRPTSWLSLRLPFGRLWAVDHGSSVALIYGASMTLWLFLVLFSAVQLAYGGKTPDWWAAGGVLLLATGAVIAAARWIAKERCVRRDTMRLAAKFAVDRASRGLQAAAGSTDFWILCAGLRNKQVARSSGFWTLLEKESKKAGGVPDWLSREAKRAYGTNERSTDAVTTTRDRAEYYAGLEGRALESRYGLLPPEGSPSREAYFVGLITDLPPRWIDDVATKRR